MLNTQFTNTKTASFVYGDMIKWFPLIVAILLLIGVIVAKEKGADMFKDNETTFWIIVGVCVLIILIYIVAIWAKYNDRF